jgi:hypothetical protein
MLRVSRVLAAVSLVAVVALAGCTPPAPPAPVAVGPHQRFSGLVNGLRSGAVITTSCPGPGQPGGMGHAVGGQTVAVTPDPTGAGDTGTSSVVFAQPGGTIYVVGIHDYDTPVEFPTGAQVPCDGPGTVNFLQCFGIIACTSGAPDVVKVTFVNIAD